MNCAGFTTLWSIEEAHNYERPRLLAPVQRVAVQESAWVPPLGSRHLPFYVAAGFHLGTYAAMDGLQHATGLA